MGGEGVRWGFLGVVILFLGWVGIYSVKGRGVGLDKGDWMYRGFEVAESAW